MILSVGLEKNCLLLEMLLSGCAKRMPVHVLLLHYGHFCSKTVLFAKTSEALRFTRANISSVIPGFLLQLVLIEGLY